MTDTLCSSNVWYFKKSWPIQAKLLFPRYESIHIVLVFLNGKGLFAIRPSNKYVFVCLFVCLFVSGKKELFTLNYSQFKTRVRYHVIDKFVIKYQTNLLVYNKIRMYQRLLWVYRHDLVKGEKIYIGFRWGIWSKSSVFISVSLLTVGLLAFFSTCSLYLECALSSSIE